MSELHDESKRPKQYRIPCENCGKEVSDNLRMHSLLRSSHLNMAVNRYDEYDEGDFDEEKTYVQCNACGNIRSVKD